MNDLSNSFTNDDLRGMITGNNPVSNAYRELLAHREAQGKAVVIVEESDYLTVAQMTGKEPRRKAVRELYEGALIVGSKLYAAPQLPAVPDCCEWKFDERDYFWSTSCGHTWVFSDGGIEENGVKFCHHCGKPVVAEAPKPE